MPLLPKFAKLLAAVIFALGLVVGSAAITPQAVFAQSQTAVTAGLAQNQSYTITAVFADPVPAGNITDLELYNSSWQKIWQSYTSAGGTNFSATTNSLTAGTYYVSVGLFTANWASNYAWWSDISTLNVSASTSTSPPQITTSTTNNSTYQIQATFSQAVPSGNIIDLELYDSSKNKIWQSFTTNGGTSYQATTTSLTPGSAYSVSLGLFTANWASNYAWYDSLATINVPMTTLATAPPPPALSTTYTSWKSKFVQNVSPGVTRVVRPENNNDTVSEGQGYGLLLSYFAADQSTFDSLWNFSRKYLDSKGLMNWQISSTGSIIGTGSATDADEDMAYALLRGSSLWPGHGYDVAAKNLIAAILNTEVSGTNLIGPGDSWGQTSVMNPSYLAPAYYRAFAAFTGNSRWNTIADTNLNWLTSAANSTTGLVPDWLNTNFSPAGISWDQHPDAFYYDAVRTPLRLYMEAKWNNNPTAQGLLQKENNFITQIGIKKLVSGYTLSGSPLTNYLDASFLSAYAVMGNSDAQNALMTASPANYFGSTLRALALALLGGAK